MRPGRWISVAVAAATIGSAAAASGCGGSGGSAADPVAQAAELTARAGGAQVSYSGSISIGSLATPITFGGGGYVNFASREGRLELSFSGFPATVSQKLGGGPLEMTELLDRGSVYMSSPLFANRLPNGAHWLRIDISKVQRALGLDPNTIADGTTDPSQYLQYLRSAGATLAKDGQEQLRGVPTTRYRASLDLLRAAESQPGANRALVRTAMKKLVEEIGQPQIPLEVWVDAHHLVRKLSMSFPLSRAPGHPSVSLACEFHDFGPTPAVSPPNASDVFDITGQAVSSLPGAGG
jgi:hypothetical protein